MAVQLFDYQQRGVADLRAAYRAGKRSPLFVLPTGGGKTVCFTHIAAAAAAKGLRVGLIAHRRELVGQISDALSRWDTEHGVISADTTPSSHSVQVAMAQTLSKRLPLDKAGRYRFDLLIFDEAHHVTADTTWGRIVAHNPAAKLLGVSATPCRLDGKGLGVASGGYWDSMVVGPTVAELIERGRLAPPKIFQPDGKPDLSGVKKKGGDYQAKALAGAMNKASLTGDAVKHYGKICPGAPAIAFCVDTTHANAVREQFAAAGWRAAMLSGKTPDNERKGMLADLASGQLQVLTSCNVVSEGTDIPAVVAAILLRPTASFALAMQQMGRALRVAPGKDAAYILDHAGNTLEHGGPDEPVEWRLDGFTRGKRAKALLMMKPCRVCGSSTFGNGAAKCSVCGAEFRARETGAEFEQDGLPLADGRELVQLDEGRRAMLAAQKAWKREALARAKTFHDVEAIGTAMGHHPNWARYEFARMSRGTGE